MYYTAKAFNVLYCQSMLKKFYLYIDNQFFNDSIDVF